MRKRIKRFLGCTGLVIVAGVTIFAATMPSPDAAATTSANFSDQLNVRVLSDDPLIDITSAPTETIIESNQTIAYDYAHLDNIIIKLKVTDQNNREHEYEVSNFNPTETSGSQTLALNLANYDCGEYLITVTGTAENVFLEDYATFTFIPLITETTQSTDGNNPEMTLQYDPDLVYSVKINLYDKTTGNIVTPPSPIVVNPITESIELPFVENALTSGQYIIKTTAYDRNDTKLYSPYINELTYVAPNAPEEPEPEPEVEVPDTGDFLSESNLSRKDTLFTCLIAFILAVILAIAYIIKHDKYIQKRR